MAEAGPTPEELQALAVLEAYDVNRDGKLDEAELAAVTRDYESGNVLHAAALKALRLRYDHDGDGKLDDGELRRLVQDVDTLDTPWRYMGYATCAAKAVKYGRVAFGPLAHPAVLRSSFVVSWGYVAADVGLETYKAEPSFSGTTGTALVRQQRQAAIERFTFQSLSSIVLPFFTVRSIVGAARPHFQQAAWVPPVLGIAVLPALPFIFDKPCQAATRAAFAWWEDPKTPKTV
ncbi:hypothetical protein DIPPA_62117 [Diplonema papillatum]|nr:hypothetical protein DIPPA_62117 [Diplonema papillatum]